MAYFPRLHSVDSPSFSVSSQPSSFQPAPRRELLYCTIIRHYVKNQKGDNLMYLEFKSEGARDRFFKHPDIQKSRFKQGQVGTRASAPRKVEIHHLSENLTFQLTQKIRSLYRNQLKNRFLVASPWQHIFGLPSRLAVRQWSLAPDAKICAASLPKTDSSIGFGIFRGVSINHIWSKR